MPLPTLMLKGKLQSPTGDPALKKELDEWVPVEYILEWFKKRRGKTGIENRVLILKSETASGKSTMFPPELYKALVRGTDRGIICTQPRVMTAIENVNEMLKHYSKILRLGESIGWSTKYNKLRPTNVGLLSATIGTLAQQLNTLTDIEIMQKYNYILIDETHERDLQTDTTILMLKNLLIRNRDNINCPFVILMSATFDPKSFLDYFGLSIENNFIWCAGETAGFEEMWDWNEGRTVNNYPQSAAVVVEKIIEQNPNDNPAQADILIFMPGKGEFEQTAEWLEKLNKKLAPKGKVFSLLQIDGLAVQTRNRDYQWTMYVPVEDQRVEIEGKLYTPTRRVIISTNVAETGLTLDNLKYVIDAGYNREIEYNPTLGIRGLITKPAPRSRIKQRRGRAGRKFPGVFYPLYPKYIFEKLPELQLPQILVENVSPIMLWVINEQLKTKTMRGVEPEFIINDIDMIDVPSQDALAASIEILYSIGFISTNGQKWSQNHGEMLTGEPNGKFGLTKLGVVAQQLPPMSPETLRMILASYYWGCSTMDVITIAAYISLEPRSYVGESTSDNLIKPSINWGVVYKTGLPGFIASPGMLYKLRLLISDEFIHGIILFNAIKHIISGGGKDMINNLQKWCKYNGISYRGCLDFIRARDDIIESMLSSGMEIFNNENNSLSRTDETNFMDVITRIKYCIYDGFRNNLIIRNDKTFKTINGVNVNIIKLFQENEKTLAEKSEYGFAAEIMPTFMIYKELNLKYNRKTAIYEVVANTISTLDGFVSPDLDFLI